MLFFFRFYNKKIIYDPIDYACIDETNFWIVDDDQLVKLDVEELENLLYKEGSIPINEVEAYVHAYAHLISLYIYIYIYIYIFNDLPIFITKMAKQVNYKYRRTHKR